ncbi:MAG: hypothetical protein ACHQQQ_06025 [Bacteroidota bacterium]
MKITRITSVLLALTILTGSIPYSYAYCMMMRRSVDTSMQMRCSAHRGTDRSSRSGTQSLNLARSMMLLLSKSTTDSYERRSDPVNGRTFTILMLIEFPSIQTNDSNLSSRFGVEHPPPGIVVEILNLRI